MSTNSGEKGIKKEGNWSHWGKAYLDESAIANIVSLSDAVAKGYRVRIDIAFTSLTGDLGGPSVSPAIRGGYTLRRKAPS